MIKKILAGILGIGLLGGVGVALAFLQASSNLPKLTSLHDYQPLLVSEVYDVDSKKIGEFFRERRIVIPYEKFPERLVQAFIAAEDATFFEHGGINYLAIFRAALANLKAGHSVQGASTITQQVARSLLLSPEKTFMRKIREILLSYRIESNLSKEQILYLYLNQIYFGQGAYGVEAAAQSYFHKSAKDLVVAEMAILAGLPQAPSRYTPVYNPKQAKARQRYVLRRMAEVGFLTEEESQKAAEEPVRLHVREDYKEVAPFFLETVRQYLVKTLDESTVLDKGIRIYTTLDTKKQAVAQDSVRTHLRNLDKRQGYRGPLKNIVDANEINQFLEAQKNKLVDQKSSVRILIPEGTLVAEELKKKQQSGKPSAIPPYTNLGEILEGVVMKVDDRLGLVYVRLPDMQGIISIETMKWARKPNPEIKFGNEEISRPSKALKPGDVILAKLTAEKFANEEALKRVADVRKSYAKNPDILKEIPKFEDYRELQLEQDPIAQGALVSFDLATQNIVALVGGYDFQKSEFNRAIQAARQTGSSFKPLVYAAALDTTYTPSTMIVDAPIVYEEQKQDLKKFGSEDAEDETDAVKKWKPGNYGSKFEGDIIFRNALIQSRNIPTIKILDSIGVDRVATYARRLGIFSPLNMDLSLGLGSSSVTLYEMTKVFGVFGNGGRRIKPKMIVSVKDRSGKTLLENVSLDQRFEKEISEIENDFEGKRTAFFAKTRPSPGDVKISQDPKSKSAEYPIYFHDPDQLISPQTSYLITSVLQGVIRDPGGTGAKARVLNRPVAGKTGTTNGYYDAWFIGYSPQFTTGVWVGFDDEKTLGVGETGGEAALPIWVDFMRTAHGDAPAKEFPVPPGIVFANIDNQTGSLASAGSKVVIRQAFLDGTEPGTAATEVNDRKEEKDFLKEDLSQ